MIYVLIIAGAIALDRIVKHLVISSCSAGDTVPVLGDFFHITYVQNRGIAFSMLEGQETVILRAAEKAMCVSGETDWPENVPGEERMEGVSAKLDNLKFVNCFV